MGSESLKPKPEAQENDGVRGELDKDEAGPTGGQQNTLNLAAVLNSGKSNHISVTDLTIVCFITPIGKPLFFKLKIFLFEALISFIFFILAALKIIMSIFVGHVL